MATPTLTPAPAEVPPPAPVPPLVHGERLTRAEFERRYRALPHVKKAELIEGVVAMPSPVRWQAHGVPSRHLSTWMGVYESQTPGVKGADNATTRLDLGNEPQPDAILLIDPRRGGQARISADDYVEEAPELVAGIAASTADADLGAKLRAYQRNGVREYLVWRAPEQEVLWFVLRAGQYVRLTPDARGVLKSEVFPGLWLDVGALVAGDLARVLATLQEGIASPEHAAFVARLATTS